MYENGVKQRVIELGLTTKEKIKKNLIICSIALFVPQFILSTLMVYGINGVTEFCPSFWQITSILWIQRLFDRLFIDWYWVGKTKAWDIPGTEDLKPYISIKVAIGKWISTIVLYPIIALIAAGIMQLFNKIRFIGDVYF